MVCVFITQNGEGAAWRVRSLEAARLCPLLQGWDVCATSDTELAAQYPRAQAVQLARQLPEGHPRRRTVTEALERWRADGSRERTDAAIEAVGVVWAHLVRHAPAPPEDAQTLVDLITQDRRAVEGRTLRSIGGPAPSAPEKPSRAGEDMSDTRKRITDDSTIKVLSEKNPKREGSKAFAAFSKYKDGMTVKEAKDAGIPANDIRYDLDKNFIEVTVPEPKAEPAKSDAA